jgi:hypothetical protein
MITACFALVVLGAGPTLAHHSASMLGTVRITQSVMAGGKALQPGTYEIRDTGEHVTPLPGQSPDAQTYVEFLANGMVMAREVAELMQDQPEAVGTSGATSGASSASSSARPRVEMLKGGDFVRVSMSRGAERFLIHLPVAR